MHREIDAPVQERLLDLLGEQALAADLGELARLDAVAGGADRHDFDGALRGQFGMSGPQPVAHQRGLVERHRAAARTDAERAGRHEASPASFPAVLARRGENAKEQAVDETARAKTGRDSRLPNQPVDRANQFSRLSWSSTTVSLRGWLEEAMQCPRKAEANRQRRATCRLCAASSGITSRSSMIRSALSSLDWRAMWSSRLRSSSLSLLHFRRLACACKYNSGRCRTRIWLPIIPRLLTTLPRISISPAVKNCSVMRSASARDCSTHFGPRLEIEAADFTLAPRDDHRRQQLIRRKHTRVVEVGQSNRLKTLPL